jgi:hypothetical protein
MLKKYKLSLGIDSFIIVENNQEIDGFADMWWSDFIVITKNEPNVEKRIKVIKGETGDIYQNVCFGKYTIEMRLNYGGIKINSNKIYVEYVE